MIVILVLIDKVKPKVLYNAECLNLHTKKRIGKVKSNVLEIIDYLILIGVTQ